MTSDSEPLTTSAPRDRTTLRAYLPAAVLTLVILLVYALLELLQARTIAWERFLIFAASVACLCTGGVWWLNCSLRASARRLAQSSSRLAVGNLSQPVATEPAGPLAPVALSLETLRSNLAAREAEVPGWRSELERQVQERTAALEEARNGLERSRDFLAVLFDSLEDEVAIIDRDYRVVGVNRARQRRRGHAKSLIGETCYAAFYNLDEPCDQGRGRCPAKSVWRTGQPARVTHAHVNESGVVSYLDVVASPIRDGDGHVINVLEVARDVTDSKQLEEQVIRTSEEMATLVSLSSAIACSMDLQAILGLAIDHLLILTDSAGGGALVYPRDGEPQPTVVTRGVDPREVERLVGKGPLPERTMQVRRLDSSGAELLSVPIAAGDKLVGEMFMQGASRHWYTSTGQQLLVSIGSQLAVAVDNARLYETLQRKEEALSAFLRKYIEAQEEERKRVARDLHDETAQSLTALAMAIETAAQRPAITAEEVRSQLVPARVLVERTSHELARIIRDLRPSLLDDLGLLPALGWYADNRLKPAGIRVTIETVGHERRLAPALETTLFRIAQEAMSNIVRHAQAENASLQVEFTAEHVALDVEDDGCGFDVEAALSRGKDGKAEAPFGLIGMHERVEMLGGMLAIESRPGQGTSVRVEVPAQAL
ncbi:MAG: PAS domain-containing protein [Chloroflexi bacterium]|nr:PAS domain-containing protein [Chloroflexota bacterium]